MVLMRSGTDRSCGAVDLVVNRAHPTAGAFKGGGPSLRFSHQLRTRRPPRSASPICTGQARSRRITVQGSPRRPCQAGRAPRRLGRFAGAPCRRHGQRIRQNQGAPFATCRCRRATANILNERNLRNVNPLKNNRAWHARCGRLENLKMVPAWRYSAMSVGGGCSNAGRHPPADVAGQVLLGEYHIGKSKIPQPPPHYVCRSRAKQAKAPPTRSRPPGLKEVSGAPCSTVSPASSAARTAGGGDPPMCRSPSSKPISAAR